MNERKKIEERLKRKEQEIQALENQIVQARVYMQALADVLKMFPKEGPESVNADTLLRPGSGAAKAREWILGMKTPMHINELMKRMGMPVTRENRASLGSSLAAYVRRGQIFTRPAPNTFGLLELGHTAPTVAEGEPPDDFGEVPDTDIKEDI